VLFQQTDGSLGELIGQVYVERIFCQRGTKDKLIEIGNVIKTIFAERIKGLDWMSSVTKEKGVE